MSMSYESSSGRGWKQRRSLGYDKNKFHDERAVALFANDLKCYDHPKLYVSVHDHCRDAIRYFKGALALRFTLDKAPKTAALLF